jgi:hypothetical protein
MSTKKGPKSAEYPDYVVGYRRPPVATRFQPGTSGNPKGRPKETRTVGAILQDVLQQKTTVTENGKERQLPILEGTFRRLADDALRGDKGAAKLLLSLVDRYGVAPETAIKLADLLAEDQEILARYLPPEQPASSDTSVASALGPTSGNVGHDDNGV